MAIPLVHRTCRQATNWTLSTIIHRLHVFEDTPPSPFSLPPSPLPLLPAWARSVKILMFPLHISMLLFMNYIPKTTLTMLSLASPGPHKNLSLQTFQSPSWIVHIKSYKVCRTDSNPSWHLALIFLTTLSALLGQKQSVSMATRMSTNLWCWSQWPTQYTHAKIVEPYNLNNL